MTTMKDGKTQDFPDKDTEDEALWQLLGRAKPPTVSPYFSRRVLREATPERQETGAAALFRRWRQALGAGWRRPRMAYSGALAAALLCCALSMISISTPQPGAMTSYRFAAPTPVASSAAQTGGAEEITSQDIDVIANLDNLMAYEEDHLWIEENNAF
jgi:hypothetical protein